MAFTIDDVIARESIRDLVARYNANGDAGRFPQLLELFADDAVMEIGGKGERERYEGTARITELFTGTRDRVAGLTHLRHCTSTHQIDLVDADHATGRAYFFVITDVGLDHWGRYVDRYARIGGEWRFAERVVTTDAFAPGSLFAT